MFLDSITGFKRNRSHSGELKVKEVYLKEERYLVQIPKSRRGSKVLVGANQAMESPRIPGSYPDILCWASQLCFTSDCLSAGLLFSALPMCGSNLSLCLTLVSSLSRSRNQVRLIANFWEKQSDWTSFSTYLLV